MNLKDENSKIYSIGINASAIISVTTSILYIINYNTIAIRLWAFFVALMMFLFGTREVIAKKTK